MPARRQNDPTSDKALQGYVEEVCSLTSVAALKNATAAARLEIVLRLEEVEVCPHANAAWRGLFGWAGAAGALYVDHCGLLGVGRGCHR